MMILVMLHVDMAIAVYFVFANVTCHPEYVVKVIHKEYSRFLNQFFPTPCSYHELNMIIYTSYINI